MKTPTVSQAMNYESESKHKGHLNVLFARICVIYASTILEHMCNIKQEVKETLLAIYVITIPCI